MSIQVSVRRTDPVTVVDLSGRLTLGQACSTLHDVMQGLLAEGRREIVLNLVGITYLDSAGLGELAGAHASVARRGGRLTLVGLGARLQQLVRITRLDSVLNIASDEATAVRP